LIKVTETLGIVNDPICLNLQLRTQTKTYLKMQKMTLTTEINPKKKETKFFFDN